MFNRLIPLVLIVVLSMATYTSRAQCTIPTGLNESVILDEESTLAWDVVADAVNYRVRHRVQNGKWVYTDAFTNSFDVTDLTAGVFYEWQVRTVCADESTSYSSTQTYQTTGGGACDLPTNSTSGSITETTVDLDWDDATGSTSYKIRYRVEGGTWTNTTSIDSDIQLTGLSASTTYEWHIRNECGATNSGFAEKEEFTTSGTIDCTVPANPATGAVTKKTGAVSWDVVPDALVYRVRYKKGNDLWSSIDVTGTDTTLVDLIPGQLYSWHVRSICAVDESIKSDPGDFEYFTSEACTSPGNISDGSVTDNSAQISWDAVTEVDNYKVTFSVKGAGTWGDTNTYSSATLSTTISGLSTGTKYRYEVAAVCETSENVETFSASVSGARNQFTTTGVTACGSPSSLSNSGSADNTVDLSWSAGSSETNGYEIRYRMVGAPSYDTAFVATGNTSTTISSLEPGSTFEYFMRNRCALDNSLVSGWSSKSNASTTGTSTCTVPGNVTTSATSNFFGTVTWDDVPAATQFNVRYKAVTATDWTTISASGTTTLNITNLNQGTPYHYTIRSICAADSSVLSDPSSLVEFTTDGTSACSKPTGLVITDITSSGAEAHWNPQEGAVDYRVRYREANLTFTYVTIGGTDTSLAVSSLASTQLHELQVLSICSLDESVKSLVSKTRTFTTLDAAKESVQSDDDLQLFVEESGFQVDVYPNPSDGWVTIAIDGDVSSRTKIVICDQFGSEVYKGSVEANENINMDLGEFGSGIFSVKVFSKDEVAIQKVVVRK